MPPKSRSETEKRIPWGGELHIASLLVHFQPSMREAVHAAILAMEGAEIHLAQESKLVVTVEGPHEGFIADRMTAMHLLDGVLSAVLVFHQVEPAEHEAALATV
ncbi:nitrate reductase NapD [Skermanella aerolata]|uniref:Chaperone NapD n=1 Tax=Skermanella aerolata TaxID=393310 RepID=A0A512DVZ2_9PROT|nr:chaperone NapD [Skermanella aerolata]KJB94569.1 nitrate reductase [Skermanella aerolata KACC 11604]GEO40645.1 sorbose reductase [Skermanella aerolata]